MSATKRFFMYYNHLMTYDVKLGLKIVLISFFYKLALKLPPNELEDVPENYMCAYLDSYISEPKCVADLFRRDISTNTPSIMDEFEVDVDETENSQPCRYELEFLEIITFMLEINNSQYYTEYKDEFNKFFADTLRSVDRYGKALSFDENNVIIDSSPEHYGIIEGNLNKRIMNVVESYIYN